MFQEDLPSLVEIVQVHHDGKHHKMLSVLKVSNFRNTYCRLCGKSVIWERVTKIEGNLDYKI